MRFAWRSLLLVSLLTALAFGCGGSVSVTPADGAAATDAAAPDVGAASDGPATPGDGPAMPADGPAAPADGPAPPTDGALPPPADGPAVDGTPIVPVSCNFDYDTVFTYALPLAPPPAAPAPAASPDPTGRIAHAEPPPDGYYRQPRAGDLHRGAGDIVMPGYSDDMPLFERGAAWTTTTRCYETPLGVQQLTEPQAYDLYRRLAELTTGVALDPTVNVRSVVGIRGSYPGRFAWNGNLPNRFNDTIVLLWVDGAGPHVREFPVNTDTGAYDFGVASSSSLRPNRRYYFADGWHDSFNALANQQSGYRVRDDTNHNGHWDSDRNGWLAPTGTQDYDRTGSAHNIHVASVDAPLGTASVDNWSAGCQTIPGMASWTEFITNAWTTLGDPVSYYLVDARDIDPTVWTPCTPDGSHACPFHITSFPFHATGDTTTVTTSSFNVYSCSAANEGGPEVVYYFTVDTSGTVTATIGAGASGAVDIDVYLLDADDANACLARNDVSLSLAIGPGRYFVVADTYVSGGVPKPGAFDITVDFQ